MAFLPSQPDAVVLAGALNFRDLGGYHTVDGQCTRSGLVYRSNSLQELTADDIARLRWDLRVTTVLDLRSPKEIARDGHGPFVDEGVRYINIPVLHERDDTGRPGQLEHGLVERYLSYLQFAGDNVVEALRTIAEDDVLPIVFHCSAGKDRTGVLAALLLGCLGVDAETVVSDYAAKQHARDEIVAFLRRRPTYATAVDTMRPDTLDTDPATMRAFLRCLDEAHGGARGWALGAGLSEGALARMAERLLEPGP
jgi:protein tyrosine/serine phosphatase